MSEDIDADIVDHSDEDFTAAAMGTSETDSPAINASEATSADGDDASADAAEDSDELEASVTDAANIDWAALWAEYDFESPNVDGSIVVSETQLTAAIEASEQDIGGTARQHVADAVDSGDLVAKTSSCGTRLGYIWEGML